MPRVAVELHPEARAEFLAALAWYLERSLDAAQRFSAEVDRAVDLVGEAPDRWPAYLKGTHRVLLRPFPFSVVLVSSTSAWKSASSSSQ